MKINQKSITILVISIMTITAITLGLATILITLRYWPDLTPDTQELSLQGFYFVAIQVITLIALAIYLILKPFNTSLKLRKINVFSQIICFIFLLTLWIIMLTITPNLGARGWLSNIILLLPNIILLTYSILTIDCDVIKLNKKIIKITLITISAIATILTIATISIPTDAMTVSSTMFPLTRLFFVLAIAVCLWLQLESKLCVNVKIITQLGVSVLVIILWFIAEANFTRTFWLGWNTVSRMQILFAAFILFTDSALQLIFIKPNPVIEQSEPNPNIESTQDFNS